VIGGAERVTVRSLSGPEEEGISLLDVLIAVARRKRLILKIMFAIVGLTVLIVLMLPNQYTATSTLMPPQQGNSLAAELLGQFGGLASMTIGGGSSMGLKNPSELQVALLKSRTVEDAMIDRFRLMDLYRAKLRSTARKRLEAAVRIENSTKDGLIHVAVTDRDPQRAAQFANGYVEEFKKFSANLAVTEAARRRQFFGKELGEAKENLANAEEQMKKMEQTTGVLQIDAQTRAVIESVAMLRAQIAAKQVEIQAMRAFATGENPQLRVAEEELAALKTQQQALGASSDSAATALLVRKGIMQQTGLEYVRKLRDVKYYETIFEMMARQYEVAKIDEAREGVELQVVDRATIPDNHSSPKRILLVLGSVVFGLFVGMVWALVAEGLDRIGRNPVENARLQMLKNQLRFRKRARI